MPSLFSRATITALTLALTVALTVALTLVSITPLAAQTPQPSTDTATAPAAKSPRRLLGRARALGASVVEKVGDARAGRGEGKLDRALSLAVGIGEEAVALSPTAMLGRTLLDARRAERASRAAATDRAHDDRASDDRASDDRASDDRDAAFDSLMTRYVRILTRASAGDSVAVRQATRMQLEMGDVAVRVAALPGGQQSAAYERALRAALACAETGRGCRASARGR